MGTILTPDQVKAAGLPASPSIPNYALQGEVNKNIVIPGQQVGINQNTINTGQAALPGVQAQSNVAQQTQGADIQTKNADAVVAQQKADQANFINDAGQYFHDHKGKDGYVSPADYNAQKELASQKGIDSSAFDGTFASTYADPHNVYYNIDALKTGRQQIQNVYNLIKSYHTLGLKGSPEAQGASQLLGLVGSDIGGPERGYEASRVNLSPTIRGLIGADKGSGFRFNYNELLRIADLLPTTGDTPSAAEYKTTQVNNLLKNNYGLTLDDLMNADQASGGNLKL